MSHDLTATLTILRWLADRLHADGHPLAHVPQELADRLVAMRAAPTSPWGVCCSCGAPLPEPQRAGRPRRHCLGCRPSRAKVRQMATVEP